MSLDKTDQSIIKLLQQDPRMSYSKIADTIGISRVTVKSRLEKMLDDKHIELLVKKNYDKENIKMAMLGLEVKSLVQWDECLNKIKSLPWVLMCFKTFGKANLRVLIFGESEELLEHYMNEFRYYHCVNFIDATNLGKPLLDAIAYSLL